MPAPASGRRLDAIRGRRSPGRVASNGAAPYHPGAGAIAPRPRRSRTLRLQSMPGRRTLTEAERQASDWIVRMNGEPSAREREQFNAWLAADPANAAAYEALKRTWSKI